MPQKPPGDQITFRGTFNAMYAVCLVHSRCVTPFLRAGIGDCAQGLFSVIAGAFMFYLAHALYDQMLLNYVAVWFVALMVQRWTRPKGLVHSQYEGRPALAMLLCPFIKDDSRPKRIVEPLICLVAGFALLSWSDALGKLVMSAGFSLAFLENLDRRLKVKREREIIDARLESEYYAEGVRDRLRY